MRRNGIDVRVPVLLIALAVGLLAAPSCAQAGQSWGNCQFGGTCRVQLLCFRNGCAQQLGVVGTTLTYSVSGVTKATLDTNGNLSVVGAVVPSSLHTSGAVPGFSGAQNVFLGSFDASNSALWLSTATPTTANYTIVSSGSAVTFNTGGGFSWANNGAGVASLNGNGVLSLGTSFPDASGTPGNATQNNVPHGRAAIASGAGGVTITSNQISANSVVLVEFEGTGGAGQLCGVTPAAGSFSIACAAVVSGTKIFRWIVLN